MTGDTSGHAKPKVISAILKYHPHPIRAEPSVCANGRCWIERCYAIVVSKPQFTVYGFKCRMNPLDSESAVDPIGQWREVGVVLMRAAFVGEP